MTTEGLTLATTSATLGNTGDWLVEMVGSGTSLSGSGFGFSATTGVVLVVVGELAGGAVSVSADSAQPLAKIRDKARITVTAKYFIFVLFMLLLF